MWLANSKRQSCFYPPQSHAQEDTQNWQKKTDKPDGKTVQCQKYSVQFFVQFIFYTVKPHSLTESVWGPLHLPQFCSNHWKTNLDTAADALSLLYLNDGPSSAWFCGVYCECWTILWKDISNKKKNTAFGKLKSLEKPQAEYFVTGPELSERKFRQY